MQRHQQALAAFDAAAASEAASTLGAGVQGASEAEAEAEAERRAGGEPRGSGGAGAAGGGRPRRATAAAATGRQVVPDHLRAYLGRHRSGGTEEADVRLLDSGTSSGSGSDPRRADSDIEIYIGSSSEDVSSGQSWELVDEDFTGVSSSSPSSSSGGSEGGGGGGRRAGGRRRSSSGGAARQQRQQRRQEERQERQVRRVLRPTSCAIAMGLRVYGGQGKEVE